MAEDGAARSAYTDNADLVRRMIGLDLPDARIEELLVAYRDILGEIAKLREIDLTDIHPAVVFRPARDQDMPE